MSNVRGNKNKQRRNAGKRNRGPMGPYRAGGNANYASFVRPGFGPAPKVEFVRFRYHEEQTLGSLTAGSVTGYVFRMNSCFDPNKTGTGAQPLYWDQKVAMYNRYLVMKFKASVRVILADIGSIAMAPLNGTLTAAAVTDLDVLCESVWSKRAVTGYQGHGIVPRLTLTISLPKLTSRPEQYRTDDRYQALTTTNPAEVLDLSIAIYNSSTITYAPRLVVDLEYFTELFDPILPSESSRYQQIERKQAVICDRKRLSVRSISR